MLILSRKQGEKIILKTKDGVIELVVCKVSGRIARIGIEAPSTVEILREEVKHGTSRNG